MKPIKRTAKQWKARGYKIVCKKRKLLYSHREVEKLDDNDVLVIRTTSSRHARSILYDFKGVGTIRRYFDWRCLSFKYRVSVKIKDWKWKHFSISDTYYARHLR